MSQEQIHKHVIMFILVPNSLVRGITSCGTIKNACKQCSPYQAVTGKIYCLKQQFLPPATS